MATIHSIIIYTCIGIYRYVCTACMYVNIYVCMYSMYNRQGIHMQLPLSMECHFCQTKYSKCMLTFCYHFESCIVIYSDLQFYLVNGCH